MASARRAPSGAPLPHLCAAAAGLLVGPRCRPLEAAADPGIRCRCAPLRTPSCAGGRRCSEGRALLATLLEGTALSAAAGGAQCRRRCRGAPSAPPLLHRFARPLERRPRVGCRPPPVPVRRPCPAVAAPRVRGGRRRGRLRRRYRRRRGRSWRGTEGADAVAAGHPAVEKMKRGPMVAMGAPPMVA